MAKVTDIQDKNGVLNEIQDKDLANRTSQTVVNSGDYILLEDTNGAYHKIAKASFTEAVRRALGSVINSVAKGTDIAKVPVLDSNNDLGMGTLANLASVLGDLTLTSIGPGQSLSSRPGGKFWIGKASNITDAPPVSDTSHGLLAVRFKHIEGYLTICTDVDVKGAWKRVKDSVSWVEL